MISAQNSLDLASIGLDLMLAEVYENTHLRTTA